MNGGDDEQRVLEWEDGLPAGSDLTPLSQLLIPPELASAFRISPEPPRSAMDVQVASQSSFSSLLSSPCPFTFPQNHDEPEPVKEDSNPVGGDENSSRASKRPRLVWTPQLHKRFVEVVAHLGLKNAVPKTIMQLMNVEGLTRENVASHLQKYRLYVKRMQGISDDGPLSPTSSQSVSMPTATAPGLVRPYAVSGDTRLVSYPSFGHN